MSLNFDPLSGRLFQNRSPGTGESSPDYSDDVDSLLSSADKAAMRGVLQLVPGTDVAAQSSILPIASQAEAESGTATNKVMTPQRTAQAIAAAHIRAYNAIRGHTVAATSTVVSSTYESAFTVSHGIMAVINYNGVEVFLYGEDADYSGGLGFTPTSNHINIGYWSSASESAPPVPSASSLAGVLDGREGFTVSYNLTFTSLSTGPVVAPTITSGNLLTFTSTTVGADASGSIPEIVLIPGVEGKTIKTTALWVRQTESAMSGALTCDVGLLKDGIYTPIVVALDPTPTNTIVPNDVYPERFVGGADAGESLVARFIGATPVGGEIRWIVIAEQS